MPKIQCPHCLVSFDPKVNTPYAKTDSEKLALETKEIEEHSKKLTLEEFEKLHSFHGFQDELDFCDQ